MLRWLLVILLLVLGMLQYRLWIADGSLAELQRLNRQMHAQTEVNRQLQERNAVLEREVLDLQTGNEGVEQRAREQLGLIREDEVFYQFPADQKDRTTGSNPPRQETPE
jgi:cell division protein FtsB